MSGVFNLNWKDVLNGLITSVIGALLTFFYQLIDPCLSVIQGISCHVSVNWDAVLIVAVGAGLSYLVKRFGSNNQGEFLK